MPHARTVVAADGPSTATVDGPRAASVDRPRAATPTQLTDEQLVAEVRRLAGCERDATVALIAHLAEFDARRLYLGAGFSSVFAYCTAMLRLAEHAAYNRIEAARASRRFPVILARLRDGTLTLATLRLLAPHLTHENHETLLASASGRSKRDVEELVAARFPRPDTPDAVRRLPQPPSPMTTPAASSSPPPALLVPRIPPLQAVVAQSMQAVAAQMPDRHQVVEPLATDRYKIAFTSSSETRDKLRRAQDLLRHQIPDGNLAQIFDRALSALVAQLEREKLAAIERPRASHGSKAGSRHVPADVRRAVWLRDHGRCAFVAKDGRRCGERGMLEFHHARPYAADGEASTANISLRCRPHNGYEAELYFGPMRYGPGEYGPGEYAATRPGASSASPT